MRDNKKFAKMFCDVIRTMSRKPENIENLENYLAYHFADWLKVYANNPEDIAMEMKSFAEMKIQR